MGEYKLNDGTFFKLPSYEDRQEIKNSMSGFDEGDSKGKERGGRGLRLIGGNSNGSLIHIRSEDGKAPKTDVQPDIDLNTIFDVNDATNKMDGTEDRIEEYNWHAHPNVLWVSLDKGNTWMTNDDYNKIKLGETQSGSNFIDIKERYTDQGASKKDINRTRKYQPQSKGFVLTPKFNKVYYFDKDTPSTREEGGGESGSFNLEKFYNVKAKQSPK